MVFIPPFRKGGQGGFAVNQLKSCFKLGPRVCGFVMPAQAGIQVRAITRQLPAFGTLN
jgi:hypothetical protein